MALKVRVTWPNAGSPLLPESGATVLLFADGKFLAPSSTATGERTFDVPDGTTELKLSASFTVSFGAVSGKAPDGGLMNIPAMGREVLRAEQTYTVSGNALTAVSIPAFAGPHPLVVTKGAANAHGVAAITLRTLFVDISGFWEQYCENWPYYLAQHTPGMTTHVLGFTGGMPVVWHANVPDAMSSFAGKDPACLVFYRPNSYAYSRVDQPHQASTIARYLCKPRPTTDQAAQDFEKDQATAGGFHYMRCGFEAAVLDSKRAVVMLHPWPSGSSFGVAETSAMASTVDAAMRFLWAQRVVCQGVGNVSLGRLGVSSFSRGGIGQWRALQANMGRVREVYGFDATDTSKAGPSLLQWINSNATNKLRFANGHYGFGAHASIQRSLAPSGSRSDVTVIPPSVASFEPGRNSVYDHFVELVPRLRADEDVRHQFAICGGRMVAAPDAPYDLDGVETFLLGFLRASDFPML